MAISEALVNSMPKRVKALLQNNAAHFGHNVDIFGRWTGVYSLLLPAVWTIMAVF